MPSTSAILIGHSTFFHEMVKRSLVRETFFFPAHITRDH